MIWPPAKEVFLCHFRTTAQMGNINTNRAGHLDLIKCFGVLPCKVLQKSFTLSKQLPFYLTLYQGQSVFCWIPFPLLRDRASNTQPHLDTSLSAPEELEVWDLECGQQFATSFLLSPCPGLCSDSFRKFSACLFASFWKRALLKWLVISFPSRLLPVL